MWKRRVFWFLAERYPENFVESIKGARFGVVQNSSGNGIAQCGFHSYPN
jgi:hypothetical protein